MNNSIILHVEDDPNDVELVGLAFRKAKVDSRLVAVNDGEQAVRYLGGEGNYSSRADHPFPTLVLLDLKLPRKSGLEVLAWIRSQSEPEIRRLPVLMLTSSNQPHDIDSAYDLGVNSYLVKPGDLTVLTELIKTIHQYWLGFNMKPGVTNPTRHPNFGAAQTA
ncbi:MAG TPA: response regulator [Verrucomicrobiae bacterium]|nr:response regulator [Verrucomicrobiae bacterium]